MDYISKRSLFVGLVWSTFGLCSSGYAVEKGGKVAEDLIIGTVFPLEGPQASYGQEALVGIELAMNHLKTIDPETYKHISLLSSDDKSTQKGAAKAAADLVSKRASLLIGSALAPNTEALVAFATKNSMPLITVSQSSQPGTSAPMVFRASSATSVQGNFLASFSLSDLKKNKVGIFFNPQDRYANDLAESFSKAFRAKGGFVVKEVYHPEPTLNFRAGITKILASGCDTILFPSSIGTEIEQFFVVVKSIPDKVVVLGGDRWDTSELRAKLSHNFPTSYFVSRFSPLVDSPQVAEFIKGFQEKTHRNPSILAAVSYDALLLAADAFKRAGTGRAKELARTLKATKDLPGLLGQMTMGADNTLLSPSVVLQSTNSGFKYFALVGS